MMRWIACCLFIIMINCSIYMKMAALYSFLFLDHVPCFFFFKSYLNVNTLKILYESINFPILSALMRNQAKMCLCLNCLIWRLWKMPVFLVTWISQVNINIKNSNHERNLEGLWNFSWFQGLMFPRGKLNNTET